MADHRSVPSILGRVGMSFVLAGTLLVALETGFRSQNPPAAGEHALPPKSENELRVFVYGESIVAGAPLPAVGFVEQLRHGLGAIYPGRRVDVMNHGGLDDSTAVAAEVVATMADDPDVVIVLTGGNEYLSRTIPRSVNRIIRSRLVAVTRIADWLMPPDRTEEAWPAQLVPYSRADLGDRLALFRLNLSKIVRAARTRGTPVLLCTVASNLRDWPPVHLRLATPRGPGGTKAYEAMIAGLDRQLGANQLAEAKVALDLAHQVYGGDAMLRYVEGAIADRRGERELAHSLFVRAKDEDPFPWRPMGVFNDVIRDTARTAGVRLIDLERLFNERSTSGSAGFDLLVDNIHPNPAGSALIAGALADELRRMFPRGAVARSCCRADEFLSEIGFPGSSSEVAYLLASGKYVMKTPFYAFALSREYFDRALAIDPRNWQAWANLATLSFFEGHVPRGRSELERAAALKGAAVDPGDLEATPYLDQVLREVK